MALLDDDDAFEAALSFLDEYASEEAKDEGLHELDDQDAPLQSVPSDDKLRRKKALNEKRKMLRRTGVYGDPNRSRDERKKEIAFLREQLQKLQLDLKVLRSRTAAHSEKQEAEAGGMTLIPKVWREMAVRQRRQREEAESENIHLKLVVEQQQKVADNLRNLLRKRAAHLAKEYSAITDAVTSGHCIDRALDFRGDIGDFDALFRHLNAAKLELDIMLANNGLANMTISQTEVHIREDIDGKYMEFFTYKELPFAVRATTEVSWNHWKGMEKHIMGNGGLYERTAKDLDQPYTIIEDFSKELYSNTAFR